MKLKLTKEQKEAILQLGDPDSDTELMSTDVFGELISLELIYKREDGNIDFTDLGESVYDDLVGK